MQHRLRCHVDGFVYVSHCCVNTTSLNFSFPFTQHTVNMRQNFIGMVVGNAMQKTVKVKVTRSKLHPIVLKVNAQLTCTFFTFVYMGYLDYQIAQELPCTRREPALWFG